MLPRGIRRGMKRMLRPYAARLFEAYAGEMAAKMPPPRAPGLEVMRSAYIDAKHKPVRFQLPNYMIPRPTGDEPRWKDGMAIPPMDVRVQGYGDTDEKYFEIAERNVNKMRAVLQRSGGDIEHGQRILDFGCSCAPMVRYLKDFAETGEVWGVDIHGDAIAWCLQHLSPPFHFALTTTFPHLPFEDGYFDLIYCTSVFSHIGEMADAWLLELARVTRPGGRVYLTMVTPQAMRRYVKEWPALGFSKEARQNFTDEQRASDFLTMVIGRVPWQHAVYDEAYFLRKAEPMFEVVSVTPNTYTFQAAVVLRKKDKRRERDGLLHAGQEAMA